MWAGGQCSVGPLIQMILLCSSAQHRNTELQLQKRRTLAIIYGRRKRRSLNVCATSNSRKTPPQRYLLIRVEDGGMKMSLREICIRGKLLDEAGEE